MSLFKRIFGKGNKQPDKQLKKDLEQINSGAITKVYPILKPGDWVGIKAGALTQTIMGTQEQPNLVAGFGYDTPSNFVFLTYKDLEGKDSNKIWKTAYENLEAVVSEFEVSSQLGGKVLTASGNDFSSEKILCKSHMMKAHQLLDAKELLVSIPRRRCMMVTSRSTDRDLLKIFVNLHNNAWQDDSYGNAPIINGVFIVVDGQITGFTPFEQENNKA